MTRHALLFACCLQLLVSSMRAASKDATVSGSVQDASGAAVEKADVMLLDAHRVAVRAAATNTEGRFTLEDVPRARYVLLVTAPDREPHEQALAVDRAGTLEVEITLKAGRFGEEVVVTATPGVVQTAEELSQPVNVIDEKEIAQRAHGVLAQVAAEEPGLHVQRTSATIGGIVIRGFTGNKVNVFVDGVRYSTGAARGGINTFLNLIDPAFLSGVEVLRGPSSAQYGSDAIGGSVQILTRSPERGTVDHREHARIAVQGGSADRSGGGSVTGSFATKTFGLVATATTRRINDVRPGEGVDSHNAVTRFFGLPSSTVIDERLPDTSFTQTGGAVKLEWAPSAKNRLVGAFFRGRQEGGKRYDQLLGGDGNLVADLKDLIANLGYVRYEHTLEGWFDQVSFGYSYNSQQEERVNQGGNGNPAASINHEPEQTKANGVQALLTKFASRHTASFGADAYFERVDAPSYGVNPTTGAVSIRRGRVPDGATYRQGGVYVQDLIQAVPGRLLLDGSLRWGSAKYEAKASDSPLVGGNPLWPDDALDVSSLTFRTGAVYTVTEGIHVTASVSRGFRAPHITDLGTLGLTGSGFEVAAPDVAGLGAEIGSSAGSGATSTGRAVEQVDPETSLTYETGFRLRRGRFATHFVAFLTDVDDNIAKQALILPPGAVGTTLGDQTITSQNANGVVFVAASTNPVLVRVNFDDARVFGFEHTFSAELTPKLTFRTVETYLRAEDRNTGLPPNIEGGTPPPEAYLFLRYAAGARRRFWFEPYVHLAARQTRISSLDLDDRRTGASRSQGSIANFFNNGARARGLVGPGADSTPNTSDDVLLATGETLAQIQARVLGPGLAANSLHPEIPGYAVFGLRGGVDFGRHDLVVDLENLGDENYRGPSWGMDAPGRGIFVRFTSRF